MEVTRQSRRNVRLQNLAFYVLFLAVIGLLAWLSTRYEMQADWTASGRHTAAAATQRVLETLQGPVKITAFVTAANEQTRRQVERLVNRYQRYADVSLAFVNPDTEPGLVRDKGIMFDGELIVEYQGRSENVQELAEEAITNALQRLMRGGERWVVFLAGHGERSPTGSGRQDLKAWARQLENKGIQIRNLNLTTDPQIPDNTSALVIASPQRDLLAGEVDIIRDYVRQGGNLLWLAEPGSLHGLRPLAEDLGIDFLPGVVVDMNTQLLGIGDPRFALVADYPPHAITQDLATLTLYPEARGMEFIPRPDWDIEPFLETLPRSWSETGELAGEISMDEGEDIPGPLTLGVSLQRAAPGELAEAGDEAGGGGADRPRQRVVIIGDGDFLADAYLGQGGNLDMGLSVVNWLSHDDALIAVPAKTAPDRTLELSTTAQGVIGFGFLLVIPLVLLGSGLRIWWTRRRR